MSKLKLSAQEGQSLPLALIVLAIGALLIPPFLAYISTNLLASRVTEEGMKEQYAADAGVEYALWKLINDPNFLELASSSTAGNPVSVHMPTSVNAIMPEVTVIGLKDNGGCGFFDIESVANDLSTNSRVHLCLDVMHIDSWEIK